MGHQMEKSYEADDVDPITFDTYASPLTPFIVDTDVVQESPERRVHWVDGRGGGRRPRSRFLTGLVRSPNIFTLCQRAKKWGRW